MRFGGHETFAVREGWLPKGINLVNDDPLAFDDPLVSDSLGVGKNMARSILHWLVVTGLTTKKKNRHLYLTNTGKAILDNDPYMLSTGTWWALHINLVTRKEDAVVWRTFFNNFTLERFDRIICAEEIWRYLVLEGKRLPSRKTLSRDVACLLSSYATILPPEDADPEEGRESPFRSLGLITQLRETGTYRINRRQKDIPPEILCYALSVVIPKESEAEFVDVPFSQTFAKPGDLGKTLLLDPDAFVALLDVAEESLGSKLIHLRQLGGERFIRIRNIRSSDWLEKHYAESSE